MRAFDSANGSHCTRNMVAFCDFSNGIDDTLMTTIEGNVTLTPGSGSEEMYREHPTSCLNWALVYGAGIMV